MKKKNFEELIYPEGIKKLKQNISRIREDFFQRGELLLSKKINGERSYKRAIKNDTQDIVNELIKYKRRAFFAQSRYNQVLDIVRNKGFLDEEILKKIIEEK